VYPAVRQFFIDTVAWVQGAIQWLIQFGASVGTALAPLVPVFQAAWGLVSAVVRTAWNVISGVVKVGIALVEDVIRVALTAISGVRSGIQAGFGRVRSLLGSLTSMLPDWKGPAAVDEKILEEAGRLVIGGFERGMASQFASVRKTLGDLTGDLPAWSGGTPRGGDGSSAAGGSLHIGEIHLHVSGATGREAGEEAAARVLERLANAAR